MCLKTDPGCPPGQIHDKKNRRCRKPVNPRPGKTPIGGGGGGGCQKNQIMTANGCRTVSGTKTPKGYKRAPQSLVTKLNAPGREAVGKKSKVFTWKGIRLRYSNYKVFVRKNRNWLRVRRVNGIWFIQNSKDSYGESRDSFEDQLLELIDG